MEVRKKLFIVSFAYGGPQLGPNRRVYYLGKFLSNYYQVKGIGISNWKKYTRIATGDEFVNANYTITRWKAPKNRLIAEILFLFVSLRKVIFSDIIVLSIPSPSIALMAPILKILGKKVVLDIRDNWSDILPFGRIVRVLFTAYIWMVSYLWVDAIISVKQGDLVSIGSLPLVKRNKLTCVLNGIDASLVRVSNRRIYHVKRRLIYIGGEGKYYDLVKYINLILLDMDVVIYFTMNPDDWHIFKSKLKPDVRLRVQNLGRYELNDLILILADYDGGLAFMNSKLSADSGVSMNKIFDYFAAGIPVFGILPDSDLFANPSVGISVSPNSSDERIQHEFNTFLNVKTYLSSDIILEAKKYTYDELFKTYLSERVLDYFNS